MDFNQAFGDLARKGHLPHPKGHGPSMPAPPPDEGPPPGPGPPPPPEPDPLGIPDLPPELRHQIEEILRRDPQNGADKAFAFLRGTDWFHQNYSGFDAGANRGLWGTDLSSLSSYRGWRSQIADSFRQSYGRDATMAELLQFANSGYDAGTVGQIAGGHAWAQANQGDVNYLFGAVDTGGLTPEQLQSLGEYQSGRQSAMGAALASRFQIAQSKLERLFQGTLATGNLTLGGAGLATQSGKRADIAA